MIDNPDPTGNPGRTKAGIAIQRQIEVAGFTQATFARELGKSQPWVSQSLLDDAERTLRRLALTEPQTVVRIAALLKWDFDTMRQKTGALGDVLLPGEEAGSVTPVEIDIEGTGYLDVVDLLSAGPGGDGGSVVERIPVVLGRPREYAAYQVSGDSMEPGIPNGANVIIKCRDYASPGNEIVAWVPNYGMVVKFLDHITADGDYVLTSYNPIYRPIWTRELVIYGVVVEVRTYRRVRNGNHGPR